MDLLPGVHPAPAYSQPGNHIGYMLPWYWQHVNNTIGVHRCCHLCSCPHSALRVAWRLLGHMTLISQVSMGRDLGERFKSRKGESCKMVSNKKKKKCYIYYLVKQFAITVVKKITKNKTVWCSESTLHCPSLLMHIGHQPTHKNTGSVWANTLA